MLRPERSIPCRHLPWPGNVRQLENTCRWLTVMASGREVYVEDLPPELRAAERRTTDSDWETALARWAHEELARITATEARPCSTPRFRASSAS